MTHEATPGAEAEGGPQHDHAQGLPDARSVPVSTAPFDLQPWHHPDHWDSDDPPATTAGPPIVGG